jgi:hypothetical protein
LETESSVLVKLLTYGMPVTFHWDGQRDVCRATLAGEAKVRVERKEATRMAREDMTGDRGMQLALLPVRDYWHYCNVVAFT